MYKCVIKLLHNLRRLHKFSSFSRDNKCIKIWVEYIRTNFVKLLFFSLGLDFFNYELIVIDLTKINLIWLRINWWFN